MKSSKTIFLFAAAVMLMMLSAGCGSTPQDRVAAYKAAINKAEEASDTIDDTIAVLKAAIAEGNMYLADPNIPEEWKPAIRQTLLSAKEKIKKLEAEKVKAMKVVADWKTELAKIDPNNVTIEDEISFWAGGARKTATMLPPPYNGIVYGITAMTPLLISLIKNVQQSRNIKAGKKKITEVVVSVDKLLGSGLVTDAEKAKELLKDKQSPDTRAEVMKIHDPLTKTGATG